MYRSVGEGCGAGACRRLPDGRRGCTGEVAAGRGKDSNGAGQSILVPLPQHAPGSLPLRMEGTPKEWSGGRPRAPVPSILGLPR